MNPRKPLNPWQQFAQRFADANWGFAPTRVFAQSDRIGSFPAMGTAPHCYPFPSLWLSPIGVGPFFSAGRLGKTSPMGSGVLRNSAFVSEDVAVESAPRTTNNRGNKSCRKPSPFFFLLQPRLRAACKTRRRAALLAQLSARRSPTIRTPRCLTEPSLAALQALRLARSRARSAARNHLLTANPAAQTHTPATQGETPFGWLFHFAPLAVRPI